MPQLAIFNYKEGKNLRCDKVLTSAWAFPSRVCQIGFSLQKSELPGPPCRESNNAKTANTALFV